MAEKVGVYVCHCGSNIAGTVDVEAVAKWAGENIEDVAVVARLQVHVLLARPGDDRGGHQEEGLTRVVVAACSPHLHEKTFRRACQNAGLNPYLFQMANVREHVSWVIKDKAAATEKVKALVSAAAERVKLQQPLEPMFVKVKPATLVVGGGIAGLQATLELADAGYHVYLVEREPSIGGHMAQFDKTFPTLDCSACILTPKMSEVGQHENVTLLTYSELEEVSGSVGNFKVKIRKKARCVNTRSLHRLRHLQREVPAQGDRRGVRGRHGLPQGDLHALSAGRAADPGDRPRQRASGSSAGSAGRARSSAPPARSTSSRRTKIVELEVGNIIIATGWKLFDCKKIPQYGYGRLANVFTNMEFERLCNAAGPTGGKIVHARRQDRAQVNRHHPLRRQPRRAAQRVLLGASAAWRR